MLTSLTFVRPLVHVVFSLYGKTFFNFIFITQNLCDCETRLITFQKKKRKKNKNQYFVFVILISNR